MENNTWRLVNFEIKFQEGYSWEKDPEKQVDRYEGKVVFRNGDMEEFSLKVDQITSQQFLNIISEQMVITTNELVNKIQFSIKQQANEK